VTVWCDRYGVIGALSHTIGNERWLHVLDVASFKLSLEDRTVVAFPRRDASRERIEAEFMHTVWPVLLQLGGAEVLHGSAVVGPHGVVALCALSDTGKSTLAQGLTRRGYDLLADDAIVLEIGSEIVDVFPLPFQARLRPATAEHFGFAPNRLVDGRVRLEHERARASLPLAAVCLLEKVAALPGDAVTRILRVAPADALPHLLRHAITFGYQDSERKRTMIGHYLDLASHVAIHQVVFEAGFGHLSRVLDDLERHVIAPVGGPRTEPVGSEAR
jgi:hypothetical protein